MLECFWFDGLYAARDIKKGKATAVFKGAFANDFHAVSEDNLIEVTASESAASYIKDAIWDHQSGS